MFHLNLALAKCCLRPTYNLQSQDDEIPVFEESDPRYWLPPYVHGGVPARDQSRMVNNRRTPSGNFFNMTNPSLYLPRVPSTNEPRPQYKQTINAISEERTAAAKEAAIAKSNAMMAEVRIRIAWEFGHHPAWDRKEHFSQLFFASTLFDFKVCTSSQLGGIQCDLA